MFVILLRFAHNKDKASQHMAGHKAWLEEGFARGVFQLSGSIKPGAGGAILAAGASAAEIEALVAKDPFVAEGVVAAEILEISASKASERLGFLLPA